MKSDFNIEVARWVENHNGEVYPDLTSKQRRLLRVTITKYFTNPRFTLPRVIAKLSKEFDPEQAEKIARTEIESACTSVVQIKAYKEYISSKDWDIKRKARLRLDGHKCRLCDEDGSRYKLIVHHRPNSYLKIPKESVENDLITVCSRCHDVITGMIQADRQSGLRIPSPLQMGEKYKEGKSIDDYMEQGNLPIQIENRINKESTIDMDIALGKLLIDK